MKFPIDIIWITDGKVVGIEKNVPAPEKETPDHELKKYTSPSGIDYVLEVNAGFSDENNIKAGIEVDLTKVLKK